MASEEGFVETGRIYEHLQSAAYTPDQIDAAIQNAHRHKLLEASARRIPYPGTEMPPALRATTIGIYHVTRLISQFAYIDAMTVDTPILDARVREAIRDVHDVRSRLDRAEIFSAYLDDCWAACIDAGLPFSWRSASAELRDQIQRIRRSLERYRV